MLLKLNFSTSLLKLSLDRLGLFLGDTLFNSLGSTVNKSLSFAESETGELTNNLDNLNLVCAYVSKNNVKLCLFLSSGCSACCRCCNCNCCSCRYAEFFFNGFNEL